MNGVRMSCVVGQKFGRMEAAAVPASSVQYSWISFVNMQDPGLTPAITGPWQKYLG
jgi:hypothetical protein